MNDIFNDMDKVIAKFSDDMREVFKNYHREEVKEEVKNEVFPKENDIYYIINDNGAVEIRKVTKEEAEQHKRFLLADAKLRKMADGVGWIIRYNVKQKVFEPLDETLRFVYSPYLFSSKEKTEQAIKEIGEDDLKLIFGIKE